MKEMIKYSLFHVIICDLSDNAIFNPQSYFEEETLAAVKFYLNLFAYGLMR